MKPKLVVHIGTPKTGTTTIQNALFALRGRMRKDCRMHFASTERAGIPGRHVTIARAALGSAAEGDAEYRALMDDFERSGCDGMLVTDELLSNGKPRLLRFFKRFTDTFDLTVICYLRRQDYFVESLHGQVVKMRRFKGVPPINEFWHDDQVMGRLDFHRVLSGWAELPAKIEARDFRKEIKSPGLMPSFLQAAGLSALGDVEANDRNISPDVRLSATLCCLTLGSAQDHFVEASRGLLRAGASLAKLDAFKPMKTTLGRRERNTIVDAFAKSNELLARDFGVKFSDERPEEGEDPIDRPDADYLLALMGQLTPVEALHFHKCAQDFVVNLLGKVPSQALIEKPAPVDTSLKGNDLDNASDAGELADMFEPAKPKASPAAPEPAATSAG